MDIDEEHAWSKLPWFSLSESSDDDALAPEAAPGGAGRKRKAGGGGGSVKKVKVDDGIETWSESSGSSGYVVLPPLVLNPAEIMLIQGQICIEKKGVKMARPAVLTGKKPAPFGGVSGVLWSKKECEYLMMVDNLLEGGCTAVAAYIVTNRLLPGRSYTSIFNKLGKLQRGSDHKPRPAQLDGVLPVPFVSTGSRVWQQGELACPENLRCHKVGFSVGAALANVQTDSLAGISCSLRIQNRAGAVVEVRAGFNGLPDACRISHTNVGSGYDGITIESKTMCCPFDDTQTGSPATLAPELTVLVLNGIGASASNEQLAADFNSAFFARTLGWSSRFYLNDRSQPISPDFVKEAPSTVIDDSSPGAVEFRFWPCSSFFFADTTLGHSHGSVSMVDPLDFSALLRLPSLPSTKFAASDKDDGEFIFGYLNVEREFESAVWYVEEYLGFRIACVDAGTSDSNDTLPEQFGHESDTLVTTSGSADHDGECAVFLVFEQEGYSATHSNNLVWLQRDTTYSLSASWNAAGQFTGTVALADGSNPSVLTLNTPADLSTTDKESTDGAAISDGNTQVVGGAATTARFNAFGVFHQDFTEANTDDNSGDAIDQIEGDPSKLAAGTHQTDCLRVENLHEVGTAAVGDVILDQVEYTIPATDGYPRAGEVEVEATCSGESFATA